ncbi:MAG TPA: uracil-DNA glycosylase [Candidatus Zambryskibacteria bacterium]|nr:uracil-DNA glycosylase [Candidatus Zambryskibacteria bacterium]HBO17812.1 uracil-DNA glycosylase [Candidatus Zambryskibacteria bacterium]HBZ04511.1 uracil-DNA glycosylase [Candidatus Zambryskibacteria bacterium]HCH59535.1 uracil-DNA glycosylase [Candidatus Zambryskibacteria bacterium]
MKSIRDRLLSFRKSPLYRYRVENKYFPVVGEGSHNAHIMFIGEAPGKTEAETAKPFCGRSGKVLDEMLDSIKLARKDVYVTNIVKDRPPENRDPTPEEIKLYSPFLDEQIDIIQPKVIATLGRFSMVYILELLKYKNPINSISEMRGKELVCEASFGQVIVVPLYHPAVALYNGSNKGTLLDDFKILKKYV